MMLNVYALSPIAGFIVSGAVAPILIEVISMNGGANPSTMLIILPSCVGATLSILTNWSARGKGLIRWDLIFLLAIVELVSAKLTCHGLVDAGSTIFTVAYCSVTVFAALFGWIFLNRQLNILQSLSILVMMLGIVIVLFGVDDDGHKVKNGIILILFGALVHSMSYTIVEFMLAISPDPIAPEMLCTVLGVVGGIINVCWQVIYTLPRYDEVIVREIQRHGDHVSLILLSYALLTLCSCVNGVSFYYLLKNMGSATTGVLKGLQAVATFITSHYAFCSLQRAQCFTPLKGVSLIVVLVGVMMFSLSSPGGGGNASQFPITPQPSSVDEDCDTTCASHLPPELLERGKEPSEDTVLLYNLRIEGTINRAASSSCAGAGRSKWIQYSSFANDYKVDEYTLDDLVA